MAVDGKLTVEIVHKGLEGITAGSASNIANELSKALKANQGISSSIPGGDSFNKVAQGLDVLNHSLKGFVEKQDMSKERLFGQFKQAQANYEVNSSSYGSNPAQNQAHKFMDSLGKQLKTWDDFSKATDDQVQETRKFVETMKNANREMRQPASSNSVNRMNYFNISELLMAAAARSATGYLTAGAAYTQGLVGTSGSALSSLQISTDISQRSAISNAVQAALPAVGMAIGSALGPLGYLGGAALGYAASVPFSMLTAARNAAEGQQLTVQSQSALVNLIGGGDLSKNQNVVAHGTGPFGIGNMQYGANSDIASLVKGGEGYLTGPFSSMAIAMNKYGRASKANDPEFLKSFGAYIASTGEDPNSLATSISFLSAKTGMAPGDIFNSLTSVGSFTGQLAGDVGNQMMTLTSQTALSNPSSAASFLSNTASFGPAFQNTASAYQGAGFQQKIAMNAIGSAFGINMEELLSGKPGSGAERDKFTHMVHEQNSRGNIEGVGYGDIMGQIIAGVAQPYYSIMDSAPGGHGPAHTMTGQQVQQNAPSAYQQAVQNANLSISTAKITIQSATTLGSVVRSVAGL